MESKAASQAGQERSSATEKVHLDKESNLRQAGKHLEAGIRSLKEKDEFQRWIEEKLDDKLFEQGWMEYSKDNSLSPDTNDSFLDALQALLPAHGSSPDAHVSSRDAKQNLLFAYALGGFVCRFYI